jgi:adenylate cyclase
MKPTEKKFRRYKVWLRRNYLRISIGLLITTVFIFDSIETFQLPLMDSPVNFNLPFMDRVENIVYDARIRMTAGSDVDDRIVIIDIDEKSLSEEGHFPWPRSKLRKLLDNLFDEYGIVMLVMDIVFAESDDNEILSQLDIEIDQQTDDLFKQKLISLREKIDTDQIFAEGFKDRQVILGYYFTHDESDRVIIGKLPKPVIKKGNFNEKDGSYKEASGYGANIELLQNSAVSGGYFDNPTSDSDGVFRKSPLLRKYNGDLYESLALAAAHVHLGGKLELVVEKSFDDSYQSIEGIKLGKRTTIPVDDTASVLIPFRGKQGSFRYVSATDVLNKTLADPYSMIGQIAFLGTTAPGLVDLRPTPIQSVFPGVEIHANLLAGILDSSFKHSSAITSGAEVVILLLIGLTLSLALPTLSPVWSTLMIGAMLSGTIMFNLHMWNENVVLGLAQPVLLIMAIFLFNMSYGFLTESRSKRHLGKLFGQYVPPELVDEMAQDPANYSVAGERRELTVLFSDIRGFTSISEKLDPTELSELLNEFLTPMTGIIHHSRGTIDKYMGDAIMAFWGAPLDDPDHAQHAMEAAQQMEFMVHELAKEFKARGWPAIQIGIGLNTGTMNVGNMGSEFRMAYTVLGDAVNLGARLESLTKQYGVHTIISEYTRDAVEGFAFREIDRVRVKGKDEPVAIFEPVCKLANVSPTMQGQIDKFHAAQKLYRQQQWDEAYQLFLELHDNDTEFLLYQVYMDRIEDFRFDPPAIEWDGVFTHSSK